METYRGVVYPWECDHMGHMNVQFYVAKFDAATWQVFGAVGLTPNELRATSRGMAAVEQTINYETELLPGDLVAVGSVLLDVSTKTIRFRHTMTNIVTGHLSATADMVAVHVDLEARTSCPLPDPVVRRARAMVEEVPSAS